MRANKKDSNHKSIVAHAESLGFGSIDVSMMKNFCDEIWIHFTTKNVYFIEIKDGSKPPSQRGLSDGEVGFRRKVNAYGGNYRLIESNEDVNKLLRGNL